MLKNWNGNKNADNITKAIARRAGISAAEIKYSVQGGKITEIRGTYMHPKLIVHIAIWISADFAVMVSDIVLEKIINDALNDKDKLLQEKDKLLQEKDKLLQKKNDKLYRINMKTDNLIDENDILSEKYDRLKYKIGHAQKNINKLENKICDLKDETDELNDENDKLLKKIDKICKGNVIKSNDKGNKQVFVLMVDRTIKEKMKYYVIRRKQKSVARAISKYMKIHTNGEEILKIDYNPNCINLMDRIKEQLKYNIKFNGNIIGLKKGYTERQFIRDIRIIDGDKYQ
jgi:hypothetical protein